jgi:VIT1/CCC1 family predicted Fe2+/Mn2+ transporter
VHVREELGISEDDLPSARLAAGSSFASFAVGASLPVLPYLFGATSMVPALLLTLGGLFLCGAFVTRLTPVPGGTAACARPRSARSQPPSRTASAAWSAPPA